MRSFYVRQLLPKANRWLIAARTEYDLSCIKRTEDSRSHFSYEMIIMIICGKFSSGAMHE